MFWIDWLMVLPESLKVAFREELIQYEKEQVMRHLTSIEELALQEGRQEGLQEGQCRIIQRLLERRWGRLSPDVEQQVRALSSQQLEELAEALLEFHSAADLQAWLRGLS